MTSTRIEEIQELIEDKKEETAKAKGKIEDILSRLNDDFGVSTIEEAETLHSKLLKDVEKLGVKEEDLETQIEDLLEKIEEEE